MYPKQQTGDRKFLFWSEKNTSNLMFVGKIVTMTMNDERIPAVTA